MIAFEGPVVTAEIENLRRLLERWEATAPGTPNPEPLSDYEAARLIQRTARKLLTACWCKHDLCCRVHQTHVSPHRNCVMR